MTTTDRVAGLNGSVGFKAPCRAATTAAITLSGEQTIDGVAIVSGDRVLVKNQSSAVDNGIYIASSGAWSRALDFDGARDARNGTLVFVTSGSTNGTQIFRMTATDPVTVGSTSNNWVVVANLDAAASAAAASASAASAAAAAAAAATFNPASYVEVAGDTMTGALQIPAGSAGAPSLRFTGDTDSGLFSKADGQVGVAINASEEGYFDSTGWVGSVVGPVTGAITATTLNGGQLAGFRNVLINGGMQISQRNGTSGTTTADDAYCVDRWYALTETGTITTTQQSLGENGTPYHVRLTQAQASAQRMGLAQIVEAVNSYPLRGSAVTLSARVRISNSQAIRYAILEWTGTADSVTSDVVNTWSSGTYTAGNFFLGSNLTVTAVGSMTPSANTWTTLTALNGTIGSSCNNLIVMIWTEATAAQNVTLDISRVQLEPGSNATPFEWRSFGTEVLLCQRYYCKGYPLGTAPGATGFTTVATVQMSGSGVGYISTLFPVPMRTSPSATVYNSTTGATGTWREGSGSDVAVSAAANAVSLTFTSTGTAGSQIGGTWAASAEL